MFTSLVKLLFTRLFRANKEGVKGVLVADEKGLCLGGKVTRILSKEITNCK